MKTSIKDRFTWSIAAISSIWLAVIIVSVFSADLISGSEHQHLPIAAILTWISGAFATKSIMKEIQLRSTSKPILVGTSVLTSIIWLAVILVSLLVPSMVTGTDPTQIPVGAILAPIAGAIVTGMIGTIVRTIVDGLEVDETANIA